jgi:tetratricopeptide (TPR) repeat protein
MPEPPNTQQDVAPAASKGAGVPPAAPSALAPVTQEGAEGSEEIVLDNPTSEGLYDLSHLPPPGGPDDVELGPATLQMPAVTNAMPPSPISALAPPVGEEAPKAPKIEPPKPTEAKPDVKSPRAPAADEGDAMQIQELQKTQNELKKALLAERKQREQAQKRVEELEQKLAKLADPTAKPITTGVPTEGVFEDLRYPALLARCRADAFTGAIQMQSGGANRTVYLKDGLPVGFHSSEPGERIGKVLVNQGRITEDQYMKATTRSVERSIKLTDALVELNLMDSETIAVELRNLTRDQIIQAFELVQGRFTVVAGQAPDANTATFDFGPGEIYVQGYRRYAPSNEMMAAYETLRDKYLIANARLASYRPKLGLNTEDERLLRLLGEALTVEEAVERAQVTPEQAARILSALQALELVEEWSPGVEQFRSRIRAEKQRHAEEMNSLLMESRQREARILEALEKALGKQLNVSFDEPLHKPMPTSSAPSHGASATASSPSAGLGARTASSTSSPFTAGGLGASGGGASSASSASPASSGAGSSPPAPAGRGPISSTTVGGSAERERAPVASSASSANSEPPPSPPASSPPAAAAARQNGASSPAAAARESQSTLSLADVKYREGVEQAATNRLDEAEVTLREAVRLDASKPEYLTALARVLLANPRYERAGTLPVVRSLLDRAVQLAPDNAEATELHQQVIKEMAT